jgi:enoyl-CoA hydratase/carnithine racemase
MVARGLKTQFMERIQAGVEPPPPCAHFAPVARELARSLARRDPEAAAQTVQRLMAVLRDHILEGLEAKRAGANGGAVGESA